MSNINIRIKAIKTRTTNADAELHNLVAEVQKISLDCPEGSPKKQHLSSASAGLAEAIRDCAKAIKSMERALEA